MSHKPKWSFHKDRGECKKSNCQTGGSNPVLYSTEQKNITAVRSVTLYVLLNKSFAFSVEFSIFNINSFCLMRYFILQYNYIPDSLRIPRYDPT